MSQIFVPERVRHQIKKQQVVAPKVVVEAKVEELPKEVVEVPENLQDALTAVSGSGPAYVFYVIESMVAAGVDLGLDRDVATQLAIQTVYGAAALIKETGEEAQTLRERVSSPNGTTVAAINTLDSHHVREAFKAAMTACRDRSIELGEENKK